MVGPFLDVPPSTTLMVLIDIILPPASACNFSSGEGGNFHENFGIPSRWIFFSTSSSPSKMYQNTNTPSDTAATPQLLRGVFASKLGCCCFDRWNAGWNLHNEEARGVWMEFVRKFHAQGICKEVTSPHAQTRTTLSRTMAAAYPRQQ